MDKNYGTRHDLKVDPSYTFQGVKVKSLADGYALNTTWQRPYTDMTDSELNAIIYHGQESGVDSAHAIAELNRRRGQHFPIPPEQSQQP